MARFFQFITVALVAGFGLLFETGVASSAEVTLRIHHFLSEDSLPHKGLLVPWAKAVEEASKGRIAVKIHPDMELGGRAPDLVSQAEKGTVDIIWTAAAYTPKRFARTSVFTLPLVHKGNPVATNLAMRDLFKSHLAVEFAGLHPLLLHVHQGHVLHMATSDVNHIDDFAGKTIRAPGRSVGRWSVEALGASATKKRHPKLPKALKKGALDGALMSFALAQSMGVAEVSRSHTYLSKGEPFGTSVYLFLMNGARYISLPDDLRKVIDDASGRALAIAAGKRWAKAGQDALEAAQKAGHSIYYLDQACGNKGQEALMAVLARYVKSVRKSGIDGGALIKAARAAVKANN